jgi:hypothetical protein
MYMTLLNKGILSLRKLAAADIYDIIKQRHILIKKVNCHKCLRILNKGILSLVKLAATDV